MHWVDMEWLWGYSVLPDSVRDMLRFCRETGAKGNINFDAVGYERLASEAPEVLHELRGALEQGQIEIVGASYGQPYGLFHGGESNIRQRVQGVRAVMRLLGVRPRTFWEEEFDFFPQLPQMLRGVGFEYACLFYQWTWHTPYVPFEDVPALWWEGQDGSCLLTAPRHKLNLHQWPEDFMLLLDSPDLHAMEMPCIVQWLELMPSPDWMCRAELMIPPLKRLMERPEFELRFVTLSEFLEQARSQATRRRYTLSEVFHGMSLGKNGDLFRRYSHTAERQLLTAESLSATAGLFGRPYPHWDVYPAWELDEAWRELLAAQHHDNDECEGLCGHVGETSYKRSLALSSHVVERTLRHLARRAPGRLIVYNPLGWARDGSGQAPDGTVRLVRDLPPLGYRAYPDWDALPLAPACEVQDTPSALRLSRGDLRVEVDKRHGVITQIDAPEFPEGALAEPLGQLEMQVAGQEERFERVMEVVAIENAVRIRRVSRGGSVIEITVSIAPECDAIDITYYASELERPDGGVAGALKTVIATGSVKSSRTASTCANTPQATG
jgi:alpha-mannosidase